MLPEIFRTSTHSTAAFRRPPVSAQNGAHATARAFARTTIVRTSVSCCAMPDTDPSSSLQLHDLRVGFRTHRGTALAVAGVDLCIGPGESWALVGESGSGKSTVALALMGLLDRSQAEVTGSVRFGDAELLTMATRELQDVRGRRLAMVFQDPMTSLTPYVRIGTQVAESVVRHLGESPAAAGTAAAALLTAMGIPDAQRRVRAYPHELSGGMRQRAMIASALACAPDLLIADEPTTALDVTIQAQILGLIREQTAARRMGLLLITHDLGVVAGMCDHVAVLYAGSIVEQGPVAKLFARPSHPYTQALLQAVPRADAAVAGPMAALPGRPPRLTERLPGCQFAPRCPHADTACTVALPALQGQGAHRHRCIHSTATPATTAPPPPAEVVGADSSTALRVRQLRVTYADRGASLFGAGAPATVAVDGVDLDLRRGEILGLVGESGCGKTSLIRAVLRLVEPAGGAIEVDGVDTVPLRGAALRSYRARVQMIFQDPAASLNPRHRVGAIIAEPLRNFGIARGAAAQAIVETLMGQVGLDPALTNRFPHEFSGGQKQRIGIARALATSPDILLCDEPVSALDVSIQAQIINLLRDLRAALQLSILFISHDLAVVRQLADRVVVMYSGRIVEQGATESIYTRPRHPYTRALLSAIPIPDPRVRPAAPPVAESLPDVAAGACVFAARCPQRADACGRAPELRAHGGEHLVACHVPLQTTGD
jgi:peptide/nickel transport system ATP-binding protein